MGNPEVYIFQIMRKALVQSFFLNPTKYRPDQRKDVCTASKQSGHVFSRLDFVGCQFPVRIHGLVVLKVIHEKRIFFDKAQHLADEIVYFFPDAVKHPLVFLSYVDNTGVF